MRAAIHSLSRHQLHRVLASMIQFTCSGGTEIRRMICSPCAARQHGITFMSLTAHANAKLPMGTSSSPARCLASAQHRRTVRAPRLIPQAAAGEAFYAKEGVSFEELGLHKDIAQALQKSGFDKPSHIQAKSAATLCQGKSAVLAAETGSGKTLSYIGPVGSLLLKRKEQEASKEKPFQFHALVLCPNLTLCKQVQSVIQGLQGADGQPLLTSAIVNSSNPPPFTPPDFIIGTPAGLLSFLDEAGTSYGLLWTETGFAERVLHVIMDEADLLFSPGYSKTLNTLLTVFKSSDRRKVEAKVFEELRITEEVFKKLPRPLCVAAWAGGTKGLLEAGYRAKYPPAADAQLGPYWSRQYIFAAATMPAITYADVGQQIERFCPSAAWISTPALHTSKFQVTHAWLQVDDDTFEKTLIQTITEDPDYKAGKAKTLVFTQHTRAADELSSFLASKRIEHHVYHKGRPVEEQRQALHSMQEGAGVMVCTDAAARGLDIQDLTHVIQADFASNAIDFIHRIGRTARGARGGKVTSLYRDQNLALVEVLRQYIEEGRPLEAAFSRARSFSKKLDRRGSFVPRGMTTTDYNTQKQKQSPGSKQESSAATE